MNNKLENMTFKELLDIKKATELLIEQYTKKLSNYNLNCMVHDYMNESSYLERINNESKIIIDKRTKCMELSEKIVNVIEKKIENFYD